jgi:Transposase and inactivated derivatives
MSEFIAENENEFNVSIATSALGISRATFYRYKNKQPTQTEVRREEIRKQVLDIYKSSEGRYGAPKILQVLNNQRDDTVGIKLVQKLMAEEKIQSVIVKKHRANKAGNPVPERMNLLERNFKTNGLNEKWVGDITYIHTENDGWTYLATFMDLHSRRIVGYAYGKYMTDNLVMNAFGNAMLNRDVPASLIVHTDLGAQFTGLEFETLLQQVGAQHSYSHKANPYDNAVIEAFHATYKKEELYVNKNHYKTFKQARRFVFDYIERWYNRVRIHGSIGNVSPAEFEATLMS